MEFRSADSGLSGRNVFLPLLVGKFVLQSGRIVDIHVPHQQRNVDRQPEQVEQRHEDTSVLVDLLRTIVGGSSGQVNRK